MTAITEREPARAEAKARPSASLRGRVQDWLPRLVLAPSFLLVLIFVYGFNLWTLFLSFTNSKAFPTTNLIGITNYVRLSNWTFETDPPSNWYTALVNMALFGSLYVFLPIPWIVAGNSS
jgi:glucose/mannose transport system permease protein